MLVGYRTVRETKPKTWAGREGWGLNGTCWARGRDRHLDARRWARRARLLAMCVRRFFSRSIASRTSSSSASVARAVTPPFTM